MSTVLFIENEYQTERHFTRGFRVGSVRSGWNPVVVWLRDAEGKLKPVHELSREIEEHAPNLMVWIMDSILPRAECLETHVLKSIPKVSLWFDDYHRTYAIHRYLEDHQRLIREASLKTYVWDGYWRKEFSQHFKIACQPIHLAADDVDYFPAEATHFKEFEDSLVFVGTIPSLRYILDQADLLPKSCSQLVHNIHQLTAHSAYGRLPYDILKEAYEALTPKIKIGVDQFRQNLAQSILINRLAWLLGKREVRLRILRLAVQQRQVVILSGHSDQSFAQVAELSKDFEGSRFSPKFINTNHVQLHQLGSLYHIGMLHLQATDPQSVLGGIPFRVFETAASGRPLLTDFKPELANCFKPEEEILCYQSDQDFPDKLSKALKDPSRLKEIGKLSHKRFLKEHTWKHRFQQLVTQSLF